MKREFPWPRVKDKDVIKIPQSELQHKLTEMTQYAVDRKLIGKESMDTFNQNHVTGYMVDGTRVLLVDHDYDWEIQGVTFGQLHDGAKALIAAKQTKAVGVEFFLPELYRNAKHIPLIGKKLIDLEVDIGKLSFADTLAANIRDAQKSLFIADTANSASTFFWYLFPSVVGSVLAAARALSTGQVLDPLVLLSETYVIGRALVMPPFFRNHNRIYQFLQRFGLNADDSRRLFVAAGIKEMVREVKKKTPESEDKQLVVIYPRAHTMAIEDYLKHPHRIKRLLYRDHPGLDYKLRVYEADSETQGINKRDSFDGWRRVTNRRIPLFA